MTSLTSLICLSRPPTISYVLSGTFSSIMSETSGSTLFGRTGHGGQPGAERARCGVLVCSWYESERRATRRLGVSLAISILGSKSTTYLPSGWT